MFRDFLKSKAIYFSLVVVSFIFIIGGISSCEVGLGASVDTQPPTVDIQEPSANFIVRDVFTMTGSCSDEQGLSNVTITLRNTQTSEYYPKAETPYTAKLNKEQTQWECVVNPFEEGKEIPDGSYEATVIATDKAGRKTSATKSFKIDNTPPLLILTRPATKPNDNDEIDQKSTDTYGQELSITGQVADDSNVDLMEIKVYDQDKNLKAIVPLTNVPPTIDMSVATWKDENYNKIYGDAKDGTKYYFCEVIVHDEARKIPFDENDKGNTITYYYFNEDIYSDLLSVYKATELYKILNGSYTRENIKPFKDLSDEQIATKISEVKTILDKATNKTAVGTFSLNPENNPYFEIDGYKEISADSVEEKASLLKSENPLTNGNPLNISILVGLDQAPIVEDTIGIKLNKIVFNDGKYAIDEANPIWYIKPASEAKTENELACRNLLTKVGSNYKLSLKLTSSEVELINEKTNETYVLPTLEVGNSYLVSVVGQDQNGIEVVQNYNHGIYFESNGNPPKLKITQPDGASVYLKKGSALELTGTVEAEDFTTVKLYVNDKLVEGENSTWTSSVNTPSLKLDGTGTGVWKNLEIPASEFSQNESKEYYISVKAFTGTKESEKGVTVYYDVEGPSIEITEISPLVAFEDVNGQLRNDNVNGIFDVKAIIIDSYHRVDTSINKPIINVYKGNSTASENLLYSATSDITNTTWKINTREGKFASIDKTEITIEVIAYDESGNQSKLSKVVYLNQDSDKPVIELINVVSGVVDGKDYSGNTYPEGGIENVVTVGSSIETNILDDDKIEQISVTIRPNGTNDENQVIREIFEGAELKSNFDIPKDIGSYLIEIIATDNTGIPSDLVKFWFRVKAGDPSIFINNGKYFGSTGKTITVEGSVSGYGGLVVYNDYDKENPSNGKISGPQPDSLSTSFNFRDDFIVTENIEGEYNKNYTVVDAGKGTKTATFNYTVDLSKPTVLIASQIPLQGISSTDYKFSGTTADVNNEFTSGVEAVFYQIVKADAAAPTVQSEGWTSVLASSTWSFYQKFKEAKARAEDEGLPEGSYKLYVYAQDKAGNVSSIVNTSFDVDLSNPAVGLYYNEVLAADNRVEKTNKDYKFSFVVADSYELANTPYSLEVTRDSAALVKGTDYTVSSSDGKYNVTFTNYIDGNYVFKVTAIDWKGKETTSTLNVTLDKTAPVIEVISPVADEWQTATKLSIKGTSEDASRVTLISAKDSHGNSVAVTGTTSWSVKDITTVEGESTYTFVSTDTLGNVSEEKEYTLKVDHNDPVIDSCFININNSGDSKIEANSTVMVNKTFKLRGSVSDSYKLNTVELTLTNGITTLTPELSVGKSTDKNWNWEKSFNVSGNDIDLQNGEWTVTVKVTDKSGKEVSSKFKVVVDTVAPVISKPTLNFEEAATDGWFNKNSGTISGSVTDATSKVLNVSYLVSNERYYIDGVANHSQLTDQSFENTLGLTNNNYSRKHTFAEGMNYVYIKAEDNAGNVSYYGQNGDVTCQIDTTVPVITFETPSNGAMISKNVAVAYTIKVLDEGSGFADGAKATVKVVDDSTTRYTASVAITQGTISGTIPTANLTTITSDTPKIVVSVADKAGNTTESALSLAMDNTAPTVKIANPAASVVNGKIEINGTASDNVGLSSVKLYRTKLGSEATSITVNSKAYYLLKEFAGVEGYNWSINTVDTSVSPYTDGASIEFYVVATDTAGNEAVATKTVTIDQDADRPIIKFSNLNLSGMKSSNYVWNKQETIYGTVSDDDGVSELRISVDGGSSWTDNLYKDGAWEYKFLSDGKDELMFKVVDSEGAVFTSATGSAMANSPKLTDSQATPNTFGYKVSGSYPNTSDTNVYLTVDTQNPALKTVYYNTSFDNSMALVYPLTDPNWNIDSTINTTLFGGPSSKLYLYITSADANGIENITATLDGSSSGVTVEKTGNVTIQDGVNAVPGKISVISIDTSVGSNWKKIEVTTVDKSGREGKLNYSIQQDNNAPIIKFTSHAQKAQVYGSGLVTVRGNADDVKDLYLKVTSSASAPSVADLSTWQKIDEYTSGAAWAIEFDGVSPSNVVGSSEYKSKSLNQYYDDLFDPDSDDRNADSKTMYVWIYGIDSLGNKAKPVSLELSVNPAGDKPTIEFSYPENNDIVGGTVRVTGSSKVVDASVSVDSVWLQIDPSYDGTFSNSWATELEALIKDGSGNYITDYEIETVSGSAIVTQGIKASGSPTSWNLPINSVKEFNNQDGTNRTIAIRAYAISSSGKTSEPTEVVFEIDPKAPVIGSSRELELVQYANGASSGTIVKRQKYTADMWISGIWYLIGSVEDDSGIKEIKLNGVNIINDSSKLSVDSDNEPTSGTHNNYVLNIPVGESSGFGNKEYVLWAKEGSNEDKDTGDVKISLNYDNQAPNFVAEGLTSTGNAVHQSNGTYTVSGTLSEPSGASGNQSGLGKIAMFFTRTISGTTYVVDPMISKGNDGHKNRYEVSNFTKDANGMYWRNYTVTSVAGNQITLSTTPHANVRVGGLCKIDNVDYLIEDVDGSVVQIDGNPTTSASSVSFAVAQIINNMTIESGTTQAYDGSISSPVTRDDGDQMVEGISKSGTTFNWTASINSSLISDGPINIHFVAFDAAGNAISKVYSGNVANNQPRLAGVKFGTDENGNSTIEDSELQTAWSGIYANTEGAIPAGYKTATEKVLSLSIPENLDRAALKVKGLTVVKPEVVGGNNGLGYTYSVDSYTSTIATLSSQHSDSDEIRTGLNDVVISVEDILKNSITDGEKTFTINVWDKTEGLTYGTNSQKAEIKIRANIAIRDNEVPKAGLKPFYWNSESDNSLYQNSRENGHIELEGDLSSAIKTSLGNDPKVSGKITFRGIATDNSLIQKINVKIPGFNGSNFFTIATRDNNGTWSSSGTMNANGWAFEIAKDASGNALESFTQETGHTVEFLLHWDTSKVSDVAAKDVKVEVQAIDRGVASWNGSSIVYTPNAVSTTSPTGANALYQMDVVPYIKAIYRAKTVNTNRTRSGAVPILRKETGNSIEGFNLGSSITAAITTAADGSGNSYSLSPTYSNGVATYTVPNTVKDGYLSVTVNDVSSLNNINDDSKEYNKEVNPYLEETTYWSDNRSVRVWKNESTDYFPGSGSPVYPAMSMGSDGTLYASFSNYSDASVYYSQMGGSATQVFYTFDPSEETDIHVSGTGTVNVAYSANYHGGNPSNWNKNSGDAGGVYVYDANAELKDGGREDYRFNKFELFYHDTMLQQFKNIRVKRSNTANDGLVHVAYYDKVTSSIHYSNSPGNGNQRAEDNEYAWVNIDGGYDEDDTGSYFKNLTKSGSSYRPTYTVENQNSVRLADSNFEGTKRSSGTGESVGLALTKSGYPVVVYYDTDNMILKVARAIQENPKGNTSYWKVQDVLATGDINYKSMVDYISCDIDANGNLHIVFQNGKNQLCYVKSTNASANGSASYTFGQSVVIASGATWIDLTLKGTTPYISYLSQINSKDGMNIAFYDSTFDTDFDGQANGEWETMVAPLNFKVSNVRSCIEAHPTPASSVWEAAVGFTPGDYYRVAYYIGSGKGH